MKAYPLSQPLKTLFAICLILPFLGCKKNVDPEEIIQTAGLKKTTLSVVNTTTSPTDLIGYKNNDHQLMMGYYRTWGDYAADPVRYKTRMTDLPDSLDIVSVFTDFTPSGNPYWNTLKNTYVPYLHARGTKVVYTGGYFAGASTNPAGLANWVQNILTTINTYNYDGYDIDIESTASGATLQDQIASFQALSQHLGPLSNTGKLLIYDTNQNGNALSNAIKNMINYVFLQAYWRSVSSLQGTYNSYASHIPTGKFLVGVSFEDGTGYQAGQMPAYAAWQPSQGRKGGVFAYGIDMEGPNTGRNYVTTRAAIQSMNPSTGVIFYQNGSYGGSYSRPFAKGSYTLSAFAAYNMVNDWASSVKIPTGWTLTLYADDNFGGRSWILTSSNQWLGGLSPSANDVVSSFKIQ